MPNLYLIDGMSLVFRAYHAMMGSNLKNSIGEPTGAVFGFTNIITSLLEQEKPDYIAVLFDTSEPTFRHEIFPEYKANRDEFPEELVPQLLNIKELLDLLSIKRIEMPGFEADDIAGTFARVAAEEGFDVYCLTSDKDYFQLVNDRIKLLRPAAKGGEIELIGFEKVKEKFGVAPSQVIDVLALIGDKVDNVPGVKGIGEKTAIPLVQKYNSLEGIYEHLDEIESKSVRAKLESDRDNAFLSKTLVTIDRFMNLNIVPRDYSFEPPDYVQLDKFFEKVGFNTIRSKWRNKGIEAGVDYYGIVQVQSSEIDTIDSIENDYKLIDNYAELNDLCRLLRSAALISLDLETSSLDRMSCDIVGISLSIEEGKAYYIPVDSRLDNSNNTERDLFSPDLFSAPDESKTFSSSLSEKYVLSELKSILEDDKIGKCGQNLKFDVFILGQRVIEVKPIVFDTMIASYVLNPDEQHNMDALAQKWLNYKPIPITELIGEKKATQISMKDIEPERIKDYACEDADIALRLRNRLISELEKSSMIDLAVNVEFPIISVLNRMESNGVAINEKSLSEISKSIQTDTILLQEKIFQEAGIEFNIDSPKQLGHVLFEKMMIPPIKEGKSGFSTDVQVLTQLSEIYPIASYVLDYRQLMKLKSTYVDTLPKLVNPRTGRIHTTYNQTIASTGRLSSTDPNLQNIPIRTDMGKEIRKAFVAGNPGWKLLSADYSQIELRIMAFICGDSQLIEGFKNGLDIHAATASILFDKPLNEVNQDMRRVAKTVNFGIMYGLGGFGLSQRLGMPRNEANAIISNYFIKYPGIKKYIDETIKSTREKGYAETLAGRRRYFKDINSKNRNLRQAAERAAINMPIQGTASDMLKLAMISIDKEMIRRKMRSMMILQVHDELVFEVAPNEMEELKSLVKGKMESAMSLGEVPVVADSGVGDNWFEAH